MITSPARVAVPGDAVFTIWIAGTEGTGTVVDPTPETAGPVGGRPLAVAVLSTRPASTSA